MDTTHLDFPVEQKTFFKFIFLQKAKFQSQKVHNIFQLKDENKSLLMLSAHKNMKNTTLVLLSGHVQFVSRLAGIVNIINNLRQILADITLTYCTDPRQIPQEPTNQRLPSSLLSETRGRREELHAG